MSEEQYIVFLLGNEHYAVPITFVQEVIISTNITKIPNPQEFVHGIMNLRGKVITVVNLTKMLGLKESPSVNKIEQRIIVLENNGALLGVEVDEVSSVMNIAMDKIKSPTHAEGDRNFLLGIANIDERLLLILDVNQIFNT